MARKSVIVGYFVGSVSAAVVAACIFDRKYAIQVVLFDTRSQGEYFQDVRKQYFSLQREKYINPIFVITLTARRYFGFKK